MWDVIISQLEFWTSAVLTKSSAGRGNNGKQEAYGIKKLRELILELAVRGKLAPQDPNDEPANLLLEKIEREKTRLEEDGLATRLKPLPEVTEEDECFKLPNGWAWSRLGEVTNYGITDKAEPEDVDENVWILDLEDVEKETSKLLTKNRFAERPFRSSKNRFKSGDVIYGKLRPYLDKVLVADEDGVCTTEMVPVHGYVGISPFYLRLVMKTPHFIRYADNSTHGMNLPRLGTDKARMALFPLAPLAEQHRIVAKVGELMALCDELEQQQTRGIEAHQILVETLLGTLVSVASPEELTEAWIRIAAHFDTLFTTEYSIDKLKQTIIQLAVVGNLVPQDPNDEPVISLLERVDTERAAITGALAKVVVEGDVGLECSIPDSWCWQPLGNLLTFGPSNGFSPKAVDFETPIRSLTLSATTSGSFKGEHFKFIDSEVPSDSDLWLNDGDILVQRGNTIEYVGVSAVYHGAQNKFIYPDLMMKLRVSSPLAVDYIHLAMSNKLAREYLRARATGSSGTMPKINQTTLKSLPIPIPPHAEQMRIAAKVNDLLRLCDALKARIKDGHAIQIHLADAIVEQAIT